MMGAGGKERGGGVRPLQSDGLACLHGHLQTGRRPCIWLRMQLQLTVTERWGDRTRDGERHAAWDRVEWHAGGAAQGNEEGWR